MAAAVTVAVLALLLVGFIPAGARGYTPSPSGSLYPIEPNPQLEGNVTIATHNPTWAALQYSGSGGVPANLSASLDPRVKNPIVVNPSGIQAPGTLQGEKVTGTYWNTTGYWPTAHSGSSCGQVEVAPAVVTVNNQPAIQWVTNASNGCQTQWNLPIKTAVATAQWPSTSPQFNVISFGMSISGPTCPVTNGPCYVEFYVQNASGSGNPVAFVTPNLATGGVSCTAAANPRTGLPAGGQVGLGSQGYFSVNFQQIENACGVGLNVTGAGATATVQWGISLNLGKGTTTAYTITIFDMAFGSSPLTLGNTIWGAKNTTIQRPTIIGNANLTALAPSFAYTSCTGGAYTAAITQSASNLADPANISVTQAPINAANATAGGPGYIEQVTYQFTYGLPNAASLTYGAFKLTDFLGVSGVQYVSVAFAGTSYSASYAAYKPGVFYAVQASASPTTAQAWVGIVQYTQNQWNSISTAPAFFSLNGLQYYWYVLVITIAGGLGLTSAFAVRQQSNLRTRGR